LQRDQPRCEVRVLLGRVGARRRSKLRPPEVRGDAEAVSPSDRARFIRVAASEILAPALPVKRCEPEQHGETIELIILIAIEADQLEQRSAGDDVAAVMQVE
jgi:hypothetical protein